MKASDVINGLVDFLGSLPPSSLAELVRDLRKAEKRDIAARQAAQEAFRKWKASQFEIDVYFNADAGRWEAESPSAKDREILSAMGWTWHRADQMWVTLSDEAAEKAIERFASAGRQ